MFKMKYAILKALQFRYKVDNRFMISHEYAAARQHSLSFWCTLSLSSARAVCQRACVCVCAFVSSVLFFFLHCNHQHTGGCFCATYTPYSLPNPCPCAGLGWVFGMRACMCLIALVFADRVRACMRICVCICTYTCTYVSMYVCMYILLFTAHRFPCADFYGPALQMCLCRRRLSVPIYT